MVKATDRFYATLIWEGENLLFEKDREKLHIAMLGHKRSLSREGDIEIVVE